MAYLSGGKGKEQKLSTDTFPQLNLALCSTKENTKFCLIFQQNLFKKFEVLSIQNTTNTRPQKRGLEPILT